MLPTSHSFGDPIACLLRRLKMAELFGMSVVWTSEEAADVGVLFQRLGRYVDLEIPAETARLLRLIARIEGTPLPGPATPRPTLRPALIPLIDCFERAAMQGNRVRLGPEAACAMHAFVTDIAHLVLEAWPADRARLRARVRALRARSAELAFLEAELRAAQASPRA